MPMRTTVNRLTVARAVAAGTPSLPIVTTPDPLAWAEAMGLPYLGEAS